MDEQRKLTLDEAMALLDKHAEDQATTTAADKKKAKVKDLLVEGAKQGRGGLGSNTKKLLDQVDD